MRLSIITINFNNVAGLRKTMESVMQQSQLDFEYIVIDGGSCDGSKEVIVEHQHALAYWCSEKDRGIYHAMNKGIVKATGDYLLFLNSGDCLHDQQVIADMLPSLHTYDLVYGDLLFQTDAQQGDVFVYPDVLNLDYFLERSLGHPATFVKRSLFQDSLYTEDLKIVSDWEFFLKKIVFQGASYRHVLRVISDFDMQGISSNALDLCEQERQKVLHACFPGMLYEDVHVLATMRKQPLYPVFEQLSRTRRLQRRIKPWLKWLLKIDQFLKIKKKH